MKKQLFWIFLFSIFMIFGFENEVQAANIVEPTKSGDLTWWIDEQGVLMIEGEGDFGDYASDDPIWRDPEYIDKFTSAVVNVKGITSPFMMFDGCTKLENVDFTTSDFSQVREVSSLRRIFSGCENLKVADFGNVTTGIGYMWQPGGLEGCNKLEKMVIPAGFNFFFDLPVKEGYIWRGSDGEVYETTVINANETITYDCEEFNGISGKDNQLEWSVDEKGLLTVIGVGDYDFTTMPQWYTYRSKIKAAQINITGMTMACHMFRDCAFLESIEFIDFDTSNIESMMYMFLGCTQLKNIDVSTWDVSKVTAMCCMFEGCENLEQLDVAKWNVSNVTNMLNMFDGCKKLKNLNVSNWDVSSVTNMSAMFGECATLEELDVSSWDVSNVTNMNCMFNECKIINNLDVSKWKTSNVTDMGYMFFECYALEELDVSAWDTGNVTSMRQLFLECNNLKSLDVSNWNVSNVTDMWSTFNQCMSLETLDVSQWDVSNVENMSTLFAGCNNLKSLDVSKWNTGNATDMFRIFAACYNLEVIDVNHFDTKNVTDMAGMFLKCLALKEVDVSNFDFSSDHHDLRYMFGDCISLERIDVSNWDTTTVEDFAYMFENCSSLKELDISNFNIEDSIYAMDMIKGCTSLNTFKISDKIKQAVVLPVIEDGCAWFNENDVMCEETEVGGAQLYVRKKLPTEVQNISLSETSIELEVGESKKIEAVILPEDADDKALVWTSSDLSIATVDENGIVTAISSGTVTVTVQAVNGVTAVCTVIVKEDFTSNIPADKIDQLEPDEELPIVSGDVNVIFDPGAVIEISHRHGDKDIVFSYNVVEKIDVENPDVQQAIDDALQSGGKVMQFDLVDSDGETILFNSDENGGSVKITVPYEAPVSANEVKVYYIAPDGTKTDMNGIYDPSTKTITFSTTHFSYYIIETDAIVELPHIHEGVLVEEVKPTCEEAGHTAYYECECGKYFSDETCETEIALEDTVLETLGNSGGIATCHSKAVCERCNKEYGEFNPDNHDGGEEIRDVKEATETEDGYTGDVYCKGCGKKLRDGTIIEATGKQPDPEQPDNPVEAVKTAKINISGMSKKIAAGKKITLTAKVTPSNATNKAVAWSTSNKKYATVNSKGVVTTKKAGAGKTVTITATAKDGSNIKAKYKISIMKHAVKSIKLSAKTKSVKNGKKLTLKATVKTTGSKANKTLKWTSSNTRYATVSSKGVVKAKKAGKGKRVKITAKATDGTGKKATITIKIK